MIFLSRGMGILLILACLNQPSRESFHVWIGVGVKCLVRVCWESAIPAKLGRLFFGTEQSPLSFGQDALPASPPACTDVRLGEREGAARWRLGRAAFSACGGGNRGGAKNVYICAWWPWSMRINGKGARWTEDEACAWQNAPTLGTPKRICTKQLITRRCIGSLTCLLLSNAYGIAQPYCSLMKELSTHQPHHRSICQVSHALHNVASPTQKTTWLVSVIPF